MTPRRAFLLGIMLMAVLAAVLLTMRAVRQPDADPVAAGQAGGDPHGHDGGQDDGLVVQFFKDPKPLPAFTLTTLDGRTIRSADLRGQVLVLNFWATWCPPCRAEIPDLVALQDKYRGRVVVLGVSMDEGSVDQVQAFATAHRVTYPLAMTTPALEAVFPPVSSLPTSYIVDADGLVRQRYAGMLDAARTEREVRVLAGLEPDAHVHLVEADRPLGIADVSQLREVPGVDLAALPPARRGEALQALNEAGCTCGCGMSVARCRVEDPACTVSLPLARQIVAEVAARR